jgi:hypothetical protein
MPVVANVLIPEQTPDHLAASKENKCHIYGNQQPTNVWLSSSVEVGLPGVHVVRRNEDQDQQAAHKQRCTGQALQPLDIKISERVQPGNQHEIRAKHCCQDQGLVVFMQQHTDH